MHKTDSQRRRPTCLPVLDPSEKPNDSRNRLPLLQQQRPPHRPRHRSVKVCNPSTDVSEKSEKTSRVADKTAKEKKAKKLQRPKAGKWRSLSVDIKQRQSNNEDTVSQGIVNRHSV